MTSEQELLEQARAMRKLVCERRNLEAKKVPAIKSAQVFTQGNFTTVLLNGKFAGMSKRNVQDTASELGLTLAMHRAIDSLLT